MSKYVLETTQNFSWFNLSFGYSTVAEWLVLSLHSKKVLGSIPGPGGTFLCGVCMFSPCLRRFSPGTPVSPTTKNMYNRPGCMGVCL